MQTIFRIIFVSLLLLSCNSEEELSSISPNNWGKRTVSSKLADSLSRETTYLSVYSEIYNQTERKTYDLTATVSLRNVNIDDTIFIHKAAYYNTKGKLIRTYFDKTIFIAPLETVEIVIDESDKTGGTGANFLFDWSTKKGNSDPLFEAVMISTQGQQGLSFSTIGKKLRAGSE